MRKECVITLESCHVEACQLIRPWILEEDMLMRLEYAWGLKYGTLDFNSETNTIYLIPELRLMFESGLWALLPIDVPLLKIITNTKFTLEKPIETAYTGKDFFEYVFVPLPGMEAIIKRLDGYNLSQEHVFPYTTLPVLHLHVQPHYVLINLYEKVTKHLPFVRSIEKYEGYQPYFHKYPIAEFGCRGTYRMWKRWQVPPDFIGNPATDQGSEIQKLSCGSSQSTVPKLRPGAYSWLVDEVGLRPTDSATYIPDRGDGEDSSDDDDGDEYVVDESDSVFQARMRRWLADLQPGLDPLQADIPNTNQLETTEKNSTGTQVHQQ